MRWIQHSGPCPSEAKTFEALIGAAGGGQRRVSDILTQIWGIFGLVTGRLGSFLLRTFQGNWTAIGEGSGFREVLASPTIYYRSLLW